MSPSAPDGARYATDWRGQARIEHASWWQPCRVVMIARGGASVELGWTLDEDVLQRRLHLRVPDTESPHDVVLQVRGEIMQQTVALHGRTEVWVRFLGPPLREEQLLELLLRLRR